MKEPLIDWSFGRFPSFLGGLESGQDVDRYVEKQKFQAPLVGFMAELTQFELKTE